MAQQLRLPTADDWRSEEGKARASRACLFGLITWLARTTGHRLKREEIIHGVMGSWTLGVDASRLLEGNPFYNRCGKTPRAQLSPVAAYADAPPPHTHTQHPQGRGPGRERLAPHDSRHD